MFALFVVGILTMYVAGAISTGLGPTRGGCVALLIAVTGGVAMVGAVWVEGNTPEATRVYNARATIAAATAAVASGTAESELRALERAASVAATAAAKGGDDVLP